MQVLRRVFVTGLTGETIKMRVSYGIVKVRVDYFLLVVQLSTSDNAAHLR